jgi:hypothetical protein
MARTRTRLVRLAAAFVLIGLGLFSYDGLTQIASAAPPPVVNTDYASYPAADAVPANCTGGAGGLGVLQGFRTFLRRAGAPNAAPFIDPGPTGDFATTRSLRRFQAQIQPGDEVVARWTGWTTNCEGLAISFPLKATNGAFFDLTDDQALVREPNGPFDFPFCYSSGAESCALAGGGFELSTVIPQLNVVCGYQLDVVIGGPLETVGPHGSYYQPQNRIDANSAGLGTFNPNPPNMLIDAANGAMPCTPGQRIIIDKQWVGTGATPPSNVPPGFQLTVTSSVSQTNATVIGTATCTVANGAFGCNYEDASAPGVPQGGLLVNADSLLTVTETGFPGNTSDITFPVGMSTKYITCQGISGPCQLTVTNTPPPPPPPPPTTPTTAPTTTIPPIDTSIVPPPPPSQPTIPPTLPATGSSDLTPLILFSVVLVPLGAVLVAVTRRRARP